VRTHSRPTHLYAILAGIGLAVVVSAFAVSAASAAQPQAVRLVDASYRDESRVVTPAAEERLFDASYREENTVVTTPAEERLFDASYREENRVPATEAGGSSWTDNLAWGGIALGIVVVLGGIFALWWVSYHHGPRHPRGPAVPTH
jgi:hypothetical protein